MRIHFIGIGGIGMSALAQLALKAGHEVSGSDLKENLLTEKLSKLGTKIFIGHSENNLLDATDVVAYSSAIKSCNPELIKAKDKNIPVWERAKMLKFLMEDKTTITVSGAHGKTTTTSLISYIFINAGLDPTIAVGGLLGNINENAILGKGEYFVAEADESDGSFLFYEPTYSVITNIDYEHLDYYKDIDALKNIFRKFMDKTKKDGSLFCCADDVILSSVIRDYKKKLLLYGLNHNLDIYAYDIILSDFSTKFSCVYKGKDIGRFQIEIAGFHNIYNALGAIGVCMEIGIDINVITQSLANFKGTRRRFQIRFQSNDLLVIDDYAHHPTEIKATLATAKNIPHKKLITIFQPHRYTRTKYLFDKFKTAFSDTDILFITDIYPAGESPIEGVSAKILSEAIKQEGFSDTEFLQKEDIIDTLLDIVRPEDLVIFLGAGDITRVCEDFSVRINEKKFEEISAGD